MNKTTLLSWVILTTAPAAFSSTVLYSNFGPPGNVHQSGGWVVNNSNQVSFGFNVAGPAPLVEIAVPVFWTSSAPGILPNQPLTVELLGPYVSGQSTPASPFPVLESWVVPGTGASGVATVQHLTSLLQLTLDPAQRYFVRMSTSGLSEVFQWAWNLNTQGSTGVIFGTPGNYVLSAAQPSPTLQVLGADGSAVPEPTSVALMALGLAAAVRLRRR